MVSVIGGLLLILGSYFVSQGKIFHSVGVFWAADLCWIGIAYQNGDILGAIIIFIGMTFGIIAFNRMYRGIFNKSIRRIDGK